MTVAEPSRCPHVALDCLNQHELIRKYRCTDCGAIMMCACDETIGRRHLAHQLSEGVELETQNLVPVTSGFVAGICNPCRGLPATSAPAAAIPGRTTKIKRYYWRELMFAEMELMASWRADHPDATPDETTAAYMLIERTALDAIKAKHARAPKYTMQEPNQAEIFERYAVAIDAFRPDFAEAPEKGSVVVLDGEVVAPEAFAARQYELQGWSAMPLESAPFHALFGAMMWSLIEHPGDPRSRSSSFGSRTAFEAREPGEEIRMRLPSDFGTIGFGRRRAAEINAHFLMFTPDGFPERGALLDLFDYWREPSRNLREYLWAHRDADVDRARRLIEILPPETTIAILRYLVGGYWDRYVGWPDLLLWRDNTIMLVEVKSSNDKLSNEQRHWIADNHDILKLPFRVAKLHRPARSRAG